MTARRLIRILAPLLLAGLITAVAPAAFAAPTSAQIASKRAQVAQVRAGLDKMRADLAAKMAQFERLDSEVASTQAQVASATAELAQLDAMLAAQQPQLDARAVHMYETPDHQDVMSVLLGTTSFHDLFARVDFLVMVGQHDAQLIGEVKAARDQRETLRADLQQHEDELVALRAQVDSARVLVQAEITAQQKTLDSLKADIALMVRQQEAAAQAAAAGSSSGPANVPNGGGAWLGATGLLLPGAWATVDGLPGSWLIPNGATTRYKTTGIAFDWVSSTYGNADNSPTPTSSASSRPYNEKELTCANKTLPFGTLLAVTYNGKRVIVVVTDRGPYISGRSLDLSTAAANAIGLPGVAQVHVDIVVPAP